MGSPRKLIHLVMLYAMPALVLGLDMSFMTVLVCIAALLIWRWALVLADMLFPAKAPELQLDTISASHFVEKVRWCMDRLGLDYQERPMGGVIGAVFLGRTVPRLRFRSGIVNSSIGNSPEILRYLWGRYAVALPEKAGFLTPTVERLAWEQRIDRVGANLQVWIYHHILHDRELTEHAWGCNSPDIPLLQRRALRFMFPFLRAFVRKTFRITDAQHAKSVERISQLLAEAEKNLADGRKSLLGGDEINFVDISFAAICGLWLQPANYGGGKAKHVVVQFERAPPRMQEEITQWRNSYPLAVAFVENLYASERGGAALTAAAPSEAAA